MTDDDDLDEKWREIQNAFADPDPEIQHRVRKAITDPAGPLFPPTVMRQLQRWDDLYLQLIQSPTTPPDIAALAKKGREHLAEAIQAMRCVLPPPPRVSKPLRRR